MTQLASITTTLLARSFATDGLLVLGVVLVTTSLLMVYRKRRAKTAKLPTSRENVERMRQQRGIRGDLEGLMVEIEQLSRRLSAQLDAKSIQLERLIDESDRRIAELRDLNARTAADETQPFTDFTTGTQATNNQSPHTPPDSDDPLVRSVHSLADQGLGPDDIARQLNETHRQGRAHPRITEILVHLA